MTCALCTQPAVRTFNGADYCRAHMQTVTDAYYAARRPTTCLRCSGPRTQEDDPICRRCHNLLAHG